MDRDYRREQLNAIPGAIHNRLVLPELTREYTLSEVAVITSAGPARALGLSHKGHLGVGADADVAVFNRDKDVARMFAYPRYVIKGGEVVVEEGELRQVVEGRSYAVRPAYDEGIEAYLRPVFQQQYTMSFDNYPVAPERVHGLEVVDRTATTS